ncbi:MAG: GlsB/YeaQ/YmgE family stress response membrane protein [Candidatus Dormibacteraceae bacterium]
MPVLLNPGSFVAWIVIGIVAGAIASRVVRGKGMGCLADLVVGVLGAFIGGILVSLFVPHATSYGFIGSLIVAVLGATVLLAVWRAISGSK